MASISGGKRLTAHLEMLAKRIEKANAVAVGFLEDATYPAGAAATFRERLAKINEKNAVARAASRQSLAGNRAANIRGPAPRPVQMGPPKPALRVAQVAFWNNFGSKRTPPRPFFSNTVKDKSPQWGAQLGAVLVESGYDSKIALDRMGEGIKDQVVQSIVEWPADNAQFTVDLKGFNKGLIDKGVMQRSVDYEVST